jgi:hypothetical protein
MFIAVMDTPAVFLNRTAVAEKLRTNLSEERDEVPQSCTEYAPQPIF